MKALFALAVATFLSAAMAQEAPKPQPEAEKPQLRGDEPAPKDPAMKLEPAAAPKEPLGLIPETLEPVPKPSGTALIEPGAAMEKVIEQKIDKTTAAQDELNARIKMRELKTKFERDPKISAELERANTAKTDYEKREALRSYYTMLYDRIGKADSSLKKRATEAKQRLTHRLDQTRVAPTEPVELEELIRAR
jgi:hypothetical protein